MFLFLWQFFIPLVVFVVAYWKILCSVRRQSHIFPAGRQRRAATSVEPVAETSMVSIEQAHVEPAGNKNRRCQTPVTTASIGHQEVRGQNGSKNRQLSRAQLNVVRTMIYITVCFTLCWMPMYLYYLLSTLEV